MKEFNNVFNATYLISVYDSDNGPNIFSTLEKAMAFCEESGDVFVDNPLREGSGWLILEHIIDEPKKVTYYNAKGKIVTYK